LGDNLLRIYYSLGIRGGLSSKRRSKIRRINIDLRLNRDLERILSDDRVLDSRKSGSDFQRRDSGFGWGYNFVGRWLFRNVFVICGLFLGFFLSFFFRFSTKEVKYTLNKCGLLNWFCFFFFRFFKFLDYGINYGRLVNNRLVSNRLVSNRLFSNRLVSNRLVSNRLVSNSLLNNRLVNDRLVNNRGLDGGN